MPWQKKCLTCKKPHFVYTHKSFVRDVKALARKIRASDLYQKGRLRSVYGIPRGGLIPAWCLASLLNLPLVLELPDKIARTHVLIMDDIVESGRTAALLLPINLAALWLHEDAFLEPQWYMRIKTARTGWVQFESWETIETTHSSSSNKT